MMEQAILKTYHYLVLVLALLLAGCGSRRPLVESREAPGVALPERELAVRDIPEQERADSLTGLFFPTPPRHEVRAVWLTTLGGLDWPATKANTPERVERQKAELTAILDNYRDAGINTVLLQTRVRGSVIYPSALEPWDLGLTGRYNQSPGYDPLQFAIDECHKRGMEVQAWLVAIPLGKVSLVNGYGKASVVKRHPALCLRSGDEWFMNPGHPDTPAYLAALAGEVATRYDVDGINLDYIRYPEEPHLLNDKATYKKYGKGLSLADWRRQNITACVRAVYKAVKACKPWVKVSSSPIGKYQDLPRYSSYGWNSRTKVFQEAERWFEEGIHDELFPMMYFDGKHFYPFAADWQENNCGRPVVPGLGIYFLDKSLKDWPLSTIQRQIAVTRSLGMGGQAYFRSRFFTDNAKGIYTYVKDRLYTTPALQPAMTWSGTSSPSAPTHATLLSQPDGTVRLTWNAVREKGGCPVRYAVYASDRTPVDITNPRHILHTSLADTVYTDTSFVGRDRKLHYAVTAIDGYGKESLPAEFASPDTRGLDTAGGQLAVPASVLKGKKPEWLVISDIYGRMVAKANPAAYVDVSSLPAGYYKLSVYSEGMATPSEVGCFLK